MLSQIPIMIDKVNQGDLDKEILRAAIIAELDAVNLYEQLARTDPKRPPQGRAPGRGQRRKNPRRGIPGNAPAPGSRTKRPTGPR